MLKEKIKVLLIKPKERPKVCYVLPKMQIFKQLVGAKTIEAKRLEQGVYAIVSKFRFLTDARPNRQIGSDIIVGNILIVATNEKRIPISLTDDKVSKYSLRFWNIETFDEIDVSEANINTLLSRLWKDEEL